MQNVSLSVGTFTKVIHSFTIQNAEIISEIAVTPSWLLSFLSIVFKLTTRRGTHALLKKKRYKQSNYVGPNWCKVIRSAGLLFPNFTIPWNETNKQNKNKNKIKSSSFKAPEAGSTLRSSSFFVYAFFLLGRTTLEIIPKLRPLYVCPSFSWTRACELAWVWRISV